MPTISVHTPSTALDDASEIPASGARCFSGQQIDRAILLHCTDDPAHELLTHDLAVAPRTRQTSASGGASDTFEPYFREQPPITFLLDPP